MSSTRNLTSLNKFLRKNKKIDFRNTNLANEKNINEFNWQSLFDEKKSILEQLKSYQRLLRILPYKDETFEPEKIAKKLLKNDFKSALQIAEMPKKTFLSKTTNIFKDDDVLANQVYQNALFKRKIIALQYLNRTQLSEPHTRSSGLHI
ncbi:hypothetical protein L1077_22225 [Pseudoalteromonas luteoviolacea]|uniref:hypothetical protein n=1 Tax=Pseudoalteromonas luteoviolacea TaxID=43657 RepID=UPI001F28E206|nr:hypothetical protein [Pseudoalteromonas luteoviolacea]MCF6442146.1 hypothetical protein [Pseudoalteromonas luteoviolacea]